jgi:hypothetical protein
MDKSIGVSIRKKTLILNFLALEKTIINNKIKQAIANPTAVDETGKKNRHTGGIKIIDISAIKFSL